MTLQRQVNQFKRDILKRVDEVYKDSFKEFMENTNVKESEGGRLPFDTGALQDSIFAGNAGGVFAKGKDNFANVIDNAPALQPMRGGYDIEYAGIQEFGGDLPNGGTITPKAFMRAEIVRFPSIVAKNAR